jgi:methylase of polypeptide subunit release factors
VREQVYRLRTWMLTSAQRVLARTGTIDQDGLSVVVAPGVHHPAPAFGIGMAPLQQAALDHIEPSSKVLELGTGAGYWALAAAMRGHEVTATDLPHVPLDPIADAAARAKVELRLLHSDLFDALEGERFDAILFNPPFHDASPRTLAETAWCGGEVVRRFLDRAPEHLTREGSLYVLMPRIDQERYPSELARWSVTIGASRWYPLLGRTDLLVLAPA